MPVLTLDNPSLRTKVPTLQTLRSALTHSTLSRKPRDVKLRANTIVIAICVISSENKSP